MDVEVDRSLDAFIWHHNCKNKKLATTCLIVIIYINEGPQNFGAGLLKLISSSF